MNVKLTLLRLMAAQMARYRQGPARLDFDRSRLAHQRIALLKLDGIGDFVLATGLLHLIRQELPSAEVTLFCRQPVGELARAQFPGWSVVEIFDPRCTATEILLDRATRRRLQAQPIFDLLLDLRASRSFIETAIASWIPAKQKIAPINRQQANPRGMRWPSEPRIYDQLVELPRLANAGVIQDLQHHWATASWLFPKITIANQYLPRLTVESAPREQVTGLLENRFQLPREKPFLLVCPGTSTPRKEYPIPALAEAILAVVAATPMPVVIAGSKNDERTTKPLHQLLQNRCETKDVSGVFGLTQHLALISLSGAILTMDSCHAHFAGALGIPAVVILGGGQYGCFGPWGESPTFRWLTHQVPCFGCNWHCIHDRPLCIQELPAEVIAKNLIEVLSLAPK